MPPNLPLILGNLGRIMSIKYLLPLVMSGLLAGCGTVSKVSKDGNTDEPVFPELKKLTFQDGTWPNLDNLRQVQDGVTRDQLYDLLGRPHFKEGLRTVEWDYLFHFQTEQGKKTCQFKVLFDKDKIARNFYWAPEDCKNVLAEPAPEVVVQPEPVAFSLDGDVGFAFDSAELTAHGRNEVSKIAQNLLQQGSLATVLVAGHTDRLGSDAYNLKLSQARAESVRAELIAQGVPANVIQATGYGKRSPLVECDNTARNQLISCLAPNRRVEITAQGSTVNQ